MHEARLAHPKGEQAVLNYLANNFVNDAGCYRAAELIRGSCCKACYFPHRTPAPATICLISLTTSPPNAPLNEGKHPGTPPFTIMLHREGGGEYFERREDEHVQMADGMIIEARTMLVTLLSVHSCSACFEGDVDDDTSQHHASRHIGVLKLLKRWQSGNVMLNVQDVMELYI